MQYKTHLAVTYAAVLPALVSTGNLTIGNTVALGVGALFPDIDHPKSFIGNRTGGISHSIGAVFGHRGLAHSLLGNSILSVDFKVGAELFTGASRVCGLVHCRLYSTLSGRFIF